MRGIFLKAGVLVAMVATITTLGFGSAAHAQGFPGYGRFGFPGNSSIFFTGPGSNNVISPFNFTNINRTNNNNIGVNNLNTQTAVSGPASVSGNLFGGSAISGPASNFNSANTNIGLTNF